MNFHSLAEGEAVCSTGDKNLQKLCCFPTVSPFCLQGKILLNYISTLISGGDLHYHLSQHGVFSEKEMRFYATEIILGLEHMHNRFVVYRDLKVMVGGCLHPHTPSDNFHGLPFLKPSLGRIISLSAWFL